MQVIKESTGPMCVIRTHSYTKSLGFLLMLFQEALKDFPELDPENVQVVYYGGVHHARTFGLEFQNPWGNTCPEGYSPITSLELYK